MLRFAPVSVLCAVAVLTVGCGSSKSSVATSPSSSAPASSVSTSPSVDSASTTTAGGSSGGGDSAAFCSRLAAEVDKIAGFAAALRTPQQAAKLAEIEADNAAILAAAPSDLHDALAEVNTASTLSRKVLTGTAAERIAASKAAADLVKSAQWRTAVADYTAWVNGHCSALAHKILIAAGG